jgi:hypothetical protein
MQMLLWVQHLPKAFRRQAAALPQAGQDFAGALDLWR